MSDPAQITAAILGGAGVISLIGWLTPLPRLAVALAGGLLATAWLVAALADAQALTDRQTTAIVAAGALLAVAGGGPLTTVVFDLVDRPGVAGQGPGQGPVQRAGEVLRGGAWIGALERVAAYAALVAGWPEGLALVLAVKGLGRYPELRASERDGVDPVHRATAERFIIGTLASVLWALACAAVVVAAP